MMTMRIPDCCIIPSEFPLPRFYKIIRIGALLLGNRADWRKNCAFIITNTHFKGTGNSRILRSCAKMSKLEMNVECNGDQMLLRFTILSALHGRQIHHTYEFQPS
jgi:hypothetical protein